MEKNNIFKFIIKDVNNSSCKYCNISLFDLFITNYDYLKLHYTQNNSNYKVLNSINFINNNTIDVIKIIKEELNIE